MTTTIRTLATRTRAGLVALVLAASLLVAGAASAWSDELTVQSKVPGSNSLVLEDGLTARVSDSTEIRNADGVRIDFADIPDPVDVAPGVVMVRVEGSRSGTTVQATKITVRPLLLQ